MRAKNSKHEADYRDRSLRVIVITPFEDKSWTWLSRHFEEVEIQWTFCNGELFGKRPWWWWWFALRVAPRVRDFDLVITHAPYMTLYLAAAMRCLCVKVPHLAFSFNHGNRRFFRGVLRWLFYKVIPGIDLFVVYSQKEMDILGELYSIPREKFCFQHWAVQPPKTRGELPEDVRGRQPYVACIGKNNRDFPTFLEAIDGLPVNAVVVCPSHVAGSLAFPPNVLVYSDIPQQLCYEIMSGSLINVIPIQDASTGAGHMTIVAGMHLGKAQIVTELPTIDDYFFHGVHGLTVKANSVDHLRRAIEFLFQNPSLCNQFGENARQFSEEWLQEPSAVRGLSEILTAFRNRQRLPCETSGWSEYKERLKKSAMDVAL